jgi:hypothetical protein
MHNKSGNFSVVITKPGKPLATTRFTTATASDRLAESEKKDVNYIPRSFFENEFVIYLYCDTRYQTGSI